MNPSAASTASHWLTSSLQRAVPDPSALPALDCGSSTEDAWRAVSAALEWSPDQVARALADRFRLERADVESRDLEAARLIPEEVARKHRIIPIGQSDRTLVVASANPLDAEAEQEVGFLSGRTVTFQVATPAEIREVLAEKEDPATTALDDVMLDLFHSAELDMVRVLAQEKTEEVSEQETRTTPVVRLTNLILQKAVAAGATDIHMEPEREEGRVRFRVDGVLHPFLTLPVPALVRVVSRIKVLAHLDIADRIRPQDGRMRVEIGGKPLDLRISTVPVRSLEKVVIRILDPSATFSMEGLGLSDRMRGELDELLSHRTGIVLVTGPTGSGKTTTLYAALTSLSSSELNISTVEQPVEYELKGISQIQVEPKKGITFASALRALLRQDPDVILVGEIRDPETAEVAAHASMTGHQVLATLHTNDAVGAVRRLEELGLDAGSVSSTLRGVVAQRLVRRLCGDCSFEVKSLWDLPEEERERAEMTGVHPGRWAHGCEACGGTGLRGRAPILEILHMDRELSRAVANGAPESRLREILRESGHRDLWAAGEELVRRGITTQAELERVLGIEERNGTHETHGEGDHGAAKSGRAEGPAGTAQARELARSESDEPAAPAPSTPPTSGSAAPANGEPRPTRVLVVDDDTGTRTLIRATLAAAGYDVTEARDGEEALNALGADGNGFELVTLDLNMPRIGGMEVLEVMRASPGTAQIPVVVATHSDDEASEMALLSAGADDYLVKPVNPARLVTRLQAVLRRQLYKTGAA